MKCTRFLITLLMLAITVSIMSCGEDEENPAKTGRMAPQLEPGDPAKIVWITGNDICDRIRYQNVLIVEVRDKDGVPVPNAYVVWTLNRWPDAVGDIVNSDDPGDPEKGEVPAAPRLQQKVDNLLAYTKTNDKAETLKGMGKNGEDLTIGIGQTWIVITSTREGDTDITAYCSDIPTDMEHKIFATKHWFDLDWEFPPDAENDCEVNPIPEHTFKTHLFKVSDKSDVAGITVRYSITSGAPEATFEKGKKSIEVLSNEDGIAEATIKLPSYDVLKGKEGENKISVEIFPRGIDGHKPEVGKVCAFRKEEDITKKWIPCPQPPDLEIKIKSTPIINIVCNEVKEEEVEIPVANIGLGPASNVKVTYDYPEGLLTFIEANHDGKKDDSKVVWNNLGNLGPGESIKPPLKVIFSVDQAGESTHTATTKCAEDEPNYANNTVTEPVEVTSSILDIGLTCVSAPTEIAWLETSTITLNVINKETVKNVVLWLELPAELEFVSATPKETSHVDNSYDWKLGIVPPGDHPVKVVVQGTEAGLAEYKATVTADCAEEKEARCEINIISLEIDLDNDDADVVNEDVKVEKFFLGDSVLYIVKVYNRSLKSDFRDLEIADVLGKNLKVDKGSVKMDIPGGIARQTELTDTTITYKIDLLPEEGTFTLKFKTMPTTTVGTTKNTATLSYHGGKWVDDEEPTVITSK